MILFFCVKILLLCCCVVNVQGMHMSDDMQKALMVWRMGKAKVVELPLSQFPEYSLTQACNSLKTECRVHNFSFYDPSADAFYIKRSCNYLCEQGKIVSTYIQARFDCYHVKTKTVTIEYVSFVESYLDEPSEGVWYEHAYKNNMLEDAALEIMKKYLPSTTCTFKDVFFSHDFLCIAAVELSSRGDRIVVFLPHEVYTFTGRSNKLVNCYMSFE